jgi:hypothetical protein
MNNDEGHAVQDEQQAIHSVMETLTLLLGYGRRLEQLEDPLLQRLLADQTSRAKQHLVELLEWLRQRDPVLNGHMRTRLFTGDAQEGVLQPEEVEPLSDPAPPPDNPATPHVSFAQPSPPSAADKAGGEPTRVITEPIRRLSLPVGRIRG